MITDIHCLEMTLHRLVDIEMGGHCFQRQSQWHHDVTLLPLITDHFFSYTWTSYSLKTFPPPASKDELYGSPSTIALTWRLSQPGTGVIQVLGEIRRQLIAATTEVIIQASIKIYQQCHPLSPFWQDLVKILSNLVKKYENTFMWIYDLWF